MRDSQGLFIPLVRDSIIIIGSRFVYTFGSHFTYKRWVKILSKIWILAFLGKYSNIICWVSKHVDWGSHHSNIICWVSMRFYWGSHHLSNISWQFGPSSFVLGHFFLLGVSLGLDMKWAKIAKFFGPTIAPQHPAVRLLGRRGGFWCPRAYFTAGQVLSSVSARASSPARGTLLAFRYMRHAVINAFMEQCGSLWYMRRAFIGAFMKQRGSSDWGFS